MADDVYILPMSPAQQRLWFLDQMDPGTTMFNIPVAFRFHGPFDPARVGRVLSRIVERHEVLRTTLASVDGEPVQTIHPPRPVALRAGDLSALAVDVRDAALLRELRAAAAEPFDLARGPLFRSSLWRLAPDDHVLMLCMHHAISDGWSLGVLSTEFAALWNADAEGRADSLPALAIQYADYAHWHRTRMESGELDAQRGYWLDQLRGNRGILRLPTDRPRPKRQAFNARAYEFRFAQSVADGLHAFCKDAGVTLFMATISAYALLLARYSGQDDLFVGIPAAGRTEAMLEPLVGFFVNALVIRFKLDPSATVRDLMTIAKKTVLDAFANQDYSLDALMEALEIERDPAFEPLVQATFALQNMPRGAGALPDLDVEPIPGECMHSRYDLMLLLTETSAGLGGNMVYNSDLFERETIVRMIRHLERLLERMAAAPDAPLASLSFVTQAELYEVLDIAPETYERIIPLAPMQRDLYMDSLSHPASRQNRSGVTFPLPDPVDPRVWEEAAQALTDAQPVMRTRMVPANASYAEPAYQCILRADEAGVEVHDLSDEPLDGAGIDAHLEAIVQRPYDLHGALARHFLVKLPSGRWIAGFANHHVLLDGLAMIEAATWIAAEYARRMGLAEVPKALPPGLFHDVVPELRAKTDTQAVLAHWRGVLAGVTPLATPAQPDPSGPRLAKRSLAVPPELWTAVRRFCREQRITPQLLTKSVFAIVADAYCRCEGDLLIREFLTGRGPGHAVALGCYYLSLPFVVPRARLARDATCAELFAYARTWQKETPAYAGISTFEQRRLAPLGRVALAFNFITAEFTIPVGPTVVEVRRFTPYADGFVQFEVSTIGDDVYVALTYDRAIFAEEAFLERVLAVVRQIVEGTQRLADLALLLPQETAAQAPALAPAFVSIPERIAAQAALTPDAPAVVQGERVLGYRKLAAEAEQLARVLRTAGAGPGELVGICMERSPLMIVALVAILQTGAAYVPMDAAYPDERLRHMAADAHCRVVVTQTALVSRLAALDCALLAADDPALAAPEDGAELPARRPESTFYVLYTSGSTGLPKGAAVTDLGEWNLVAWYAREFGIGPADRLIVVSAFGFDLTQKNFFAALTTGAALVLPEGTHFEPERILATIERHRVTIVNCAPSAFYSLLDDPTRFARLASVRHVFLGGEPIRARRLETWLGSAHCRAEIVNTYGPTECTDVVSSFRLTDPLAYLDRDVPLGAPVDNVQLHVVDAAGRPLPAYAVGELCIAGLCVGTGYRNDAALTAQTFVPNPFGDGLMYRTGDLAYRLPNGLPVFFGRRDFQVKVRGLRIELGEVEAALRDASGLSDWRVFTVNETLVACVRSVEPAPALADLRSALGRRLPEYMIPQRVFAVEVWPLGPNGKVDRDALARAIPQERNAAPAPPQGETEERLARIWHEVIDRPAIRRDVSFFAIGGHSLLAARVSSRIRNEFGVELPLRAFFDAPTIATLGTRIDELIAQTLANLSDLSTEEIDRLLIGTGT
jgi:amino acid adenylation domain-containing protein